MGRGEIDEECPGEARESRERVGPAAAVSEMPSPLTLLLGLGLGCAAAGAAAAATAKPVTVRSYENDTVLLPCDVEDLGEWEVDARRGFLNGSCARLLTMGESLRGG